MKYKGRAVLLTGLCLLANRVQAADPDQADIRAAIDRGAAFLKRIQLPDGSWKHDKAVGATALAALTLLECEIPVDDPAIKKAAAYLREKSISLQHTYSISLALMFFDRLGEPDDEALIRSLGARLLAGQTGQGGWSYFCPGPDPAESNRLSRAVLRRRTPDEKPSVRLDGAGGQPPISQILPRPTMPGPVSANPLGDNSNTQFATIAVWTARRHGVSADQALSRIKARFHNSQGADGGWPYVWTSPGGGFGNSTPPMTCAGLLGLAAGHAAASQAILRTQRQKKKAEGQVSEPQDPKPLHDPAIDGGFAFLSEWIDGRGGTYGWNGSWQGREMSAHTAGFVNYYLLWSIERVCMAYGRRTIGHRLWYPWGAEILLAAQKATGSWSVGEDGVDTCFALLFLTRSNLAPDLSASLQGRVRQEVKLRAGGIASEKFKESTEKDGPVKKPRTDPELVMPGKGPASAKDASGPATEADKLSEQVANAASEEQKQLINKLRDEKGAVHTEAPALCIARLSGPARAQAREALAERLARMSETTLAEKLHDDSPEVRRGACLACAMKENKRSIPELVRLLEDPEALVARAAHAALVALTGEDLGPSPNASDAERKQVLEQWKAKWATRER